MTDYDRWLLTGAGGPEDDGIPLSCPSCGGPLRADDWDSFGQCETCWLAEHGAEDSEQAA